MAELEKELSRVRSFYTRKLKDVERRAENQMRALKRGGGGHGGRDGAAGSGRAAAGDGEEWAWGERQQTLPRGEPVAAAALQRGQKVSEGRGNAVAPGSRPSPGRATAGAGGSGGDDGGGGGDGGSGSGPDARQQAHLQPWQGLSAGQSDDDAAASPERPGAGAASGDDDRVRQRDSEPSEKSSSRSSSSGGGVGGPLLPLGEALRAERASHERELEREREAADARVAALKLRLVQTSQVSLSFFFGN